VSRDAASGGKYHVPGGQTELEEEKSRGTEGKTGDARLVI